MPLPFRALITEQQAQESAQKIKIYTQSNSHNERAVCESDVNGFIDVYVDTKSGLILGACLMCNRAGEMLSEILVAMENKIKLTYH